MAAPLLEIVGLRKSFAVSSIFGSRHRSVDSAWVTSTVSALNAIRRLRNPATVTKPAPSCIFSNRSLPF